MKNWMKEEQIHLDPQKKMQFLLLLAVCAGEALLIAVEGMFHSLGYHVVKHYIFIPCFMFLGTLLGRRMTDAARQNLWLSVLAAVWFVLAQFRHRMLDLEYINGGMFFLSYLMAFPFASALEDQEKNIGMKLASTLFLLASLGLVAYSGLLVLEWQPEYMQKYVYWDGTRLHCLWHPNVTACVFMIGIGICLSYMFHTKKSWKRLLLTIAVCLQFGIMALTNCRTSILMTCFLMGFALFLAVRKGKKRPVLLAVAAGILLTGVTFAAANGIYQANQRWHVERAMNQLQLPAHPEIHQEPEAENRLFQEEAQHDFRKTVAARVQVIMPQETSAPEIPETIAQTEAVLVPVAVQETIPPMHTEQSSQEVDLRGDNHQGTWSSDLKTLNGRTRIWKAAWDALRDDRDLRWWGTDYPGIVISGYGHSQVEHAHNSWMEMLLGLGIPGLVFSLIYTGIALWSAAVVLLKETVEYWKKIIAVLMLCILVAGFLEPFLFFTKTYYQFVDFVFFFFLGYLDLWRRQALDPEKYSANKAA